MVKGENKGGSKTNDFFNAQIYTLGYKLLKPSYY